MFLELCPTLYTGLYYTYNAVVKDDSAGMYVVVRQTIEEMERWL